MMESSYGQAKLIELKEQFKTFKSLPYTIVDYINTIDFIVRKLEINVLNTKQNNITSKLSPYLEYNKSKLFSLSPTQEILNRIASTSKERREENNMSTEVTKLPDLKKYDTEEIIFSQRRQTADK